MTFLQASSFIFKKCSHPTTPAKQYRMFTRSLIFKVSCIALATSFPSLTSTTTSTTLEEGKSFRSFRISDTVDLKLRSHNIRFERPCSRRARPLERASVPPPPVTTAGNHYEWPKSCTGTIQGNSHTAEPFIRKRSTKA